MIVEEVSVQLLRLGFFPRTEAEAVSKIALSTLMDVSSRSRAVGAAEAVSIVGSRGVVLGPLEEKMRDDSIDSLFLADGVRVRLLRLEGVTGSKLLLTLQLALL